MDQANALNKKILYFCFKENKNAFYLMHQAASLYFLNFRIIFLYSINLCFSFLEYFYIVHNHIEISCFLLLQKDFYIVHGYIFAFCFFLLQKDYKTFQKPFFEFFLCSFDILLKFLYIGKKLYKKKMFIIFLYALKNHLSYVSYRNWVSYMSYIFNSLKTT